MLVVTMLPTANVQAASKVKLNKKETTIYVGKTETLKVTGTSKKVTWTSSDKKKATVSSKGKVTAKKAGSVTITAKVGNKKYNCKVTVKNPSLNAKSKTVHVGKTFTLKLNGATVSKWSSSDKNKASVSSAGKVTAKKAGTVTITAADKAGKKYTCKVTVEGHKAGNWQTTKKATCNTTGKKVKYCTTCGAEVKTESIAKTENHVSGDWQVTVQPTENSTGTKVKNCTVCGKQLESASIDKVAHSHNYAWGIAPGKDYKTNVCSCGDETGPKAYNLGNGVYGEWKDDMAADLLVWTNRQRGVTVTNPTDEIGNYLGAINSPPLSDTLSSQAKQRALACVSDYSHNGMITTDECLAQGQTSARSVSSAWMASSDHAYASTYYQYTQGGTACLYYDSDGNGTMTYIWVLTLDY